MRIFEFGTNLPKTAGSVTLSFGQLNRPYLDDGVIQLPGDPDSEFFPLRGGEQFLFRMDERRHERPELWFGGFDERAFVVRLQDRVFSSFKDGGEKAFFNALKPRICRTLEGRYKKRLSKRQGDIFAFPLPHSWQDIAKAADLCQRHRIDAEDVEDVSILGTRHTLKGKYVREFYLNNNECVVLGSGVLSAPDHKPLKLPGVHVFAQSEWLHDSMGD